MGLYEPMPQEPSPDVRWGVGEDDDDFEPPPVDTSEDFDADLYWHVPTDEGAEEPVP